MAASATGAPHLFWCYAESRQHFDITACDLAPVVPADRRRTFVSPWRFVRWLFDNPQAVSQPPAILVAGWREAKPCLESILAARTGDTSWMDQDGLSGALPRVPRTGTTAPPVSASTAAPINTIVGHVVIAVRQESLVRAVGFVRRMQGRYTGIRIDVVDGANLVNHLQWVFAGAAQAATLQNQPQQSQQWQSAQLAGLPNPGHAAALSSSSQAQAWATWQSQPPLVYGPSHVGAFSNSSQAFAWAMGQSQAAWGYNPSHATGSSSSSQAPAWAMGQSQAAWASNPSHATGSSSSSQAPAWAMGQPQAAWGYNHSHATGSSSSTQAPAWAMGQPPQGAAASSSSQSAAVGSAQSQGRNRNLRDSAEWRLMEDAMPTEE